VPPTDLSSEPERRQAPRFYIALPVTLDNAVGQSRDISASGIYVTFARGAVQQVQPGAAIRLEMAFEHANPDGPFQIACHGEVVRVDRNEQHMGVAASITSYRFGAAGLTAT
jgi:hypothetical protein